MKNIDLNNETIKKIIFSSIELFNQHGYFGTSISNISKKSQLSKGILYHYFANKDELYLYCAKMCIKDFKNYIQNEKENLFKSKNAAIDFLNLRLKFFEENPNYQGLFYNILTKQPEHLSEQLFEIQIDFRTENKKLLTQFLTHIPLGEGVQESDITNFISLMLNNSLVPLESFDDVNSVRDREKTLLRVAQIFINGLKENLE